MESFLRHSQVIDPSLYDTDGLFDDIPFLMSRHQDLADRGALRAQRDWERHFGALPSGFAGCLGPDYNLVSAIIPSGLPDRIELVAYVTELVNLIDDLIEAAESPTAALAPFMADAMQAYELVKSDGPADHVAGSDTSMFFVTITKAVTAIDRERAKVAMQWFERAIRLFMAQPKPAEFANFDDYLEYRVVNFFSGALFGLAIFAMGLNIPEDQQELVFDLCRPVWLHISLVNDCHSWERERKEADAHNTRSGMVNAIQVLMDKHSMTFDEAKSACRAKAKECAAEFLNVLAQAKTREDLCPDAQTLFDAMLPAMTGNVIWGLQCSRYNPGRGLSQPQLEMSKSVWADETPGWQTESAGINGQHGNGTSPQHMAVVQDTPVLGAEVLEAPSRYLDSMPSKGIRDKVIDALNAWFKVPSEEAAVIKKVVNLLHGSSLLMDDIQDSSQLRRGKPAVHLVFGLPAVINTAGYRFLEALIEVRKLNERCMDIFCNELRDLYIGQSHDLSWTRHLTCPAEEEYYAMVDNKTGGLFRMSATLLDAMSDSATKPDAALLTHFTALIGRLFQIRDDYMNLTSADYTKQKGFCEDLDEGKYSLPLIHALQSADDAQRALISNLLSERHAGGKLSLDQKKVLLEQIQETGGLEYTRRALDALDAQLKSLAVQIGMHANEGLMGLLEKLKV